MCMRVSTYIFGCTTSSNGSVCFCMCLWINIFVFKKSLSGYVSVCAYLWTDRAREASLLPTGLSGMDGVEVGFPQAGLGEEARGRTPGQGTPSRPRSHGEGGAVSDGPLWARPSERWLHRWCPHCRNRGVVQGTGYLHATEYKVIFNSGLFKK